MAKKNTFVVIAWSGVGRGHELAVVTMDERVLSQFAKAKWTRNNFIGWEMANEEWAGKAKKRERMRLEVDFLGGGC